MLAILMAALAPAISHALAADNTAAWTEVCTASGSKRIQVKAVDREPVPGPADAQALEHCSYCTLQGHVPALPPSQPETALPVASGPNPLAAPHVAPQTIAVWQFAQPRAPPLFA
jgi:hypothetical protein